jgi:hypothetical protein
MWNMKCVIISVINGGTRRITEGLKKNLETAPGKHLMHSLRKTVIRIRNMTRNTVSSAV